MHEQSVAPGLRDLTPIEPDWDLAVCYEVLVKTLYRTQPPLASHECLQLSLMRLFDDEDALGPATKFDHDKGQKSAISGRRLHWRLSTGFFAFSPVLMCNLVRRAPKNLEEVAKNPVEKIASNPVTSVAVMFLSALI